MRCILSIVPLGCSHAIFKIWSSLIAVSVEISVEITVNHVSVVRSMFAQPAVWRIPPFVSVLALIVKSSHRPRWTMSGSLGSWTCGACRAVVDDGDGPPGTPANCKFSYIITIGAYCNFWMRKRHVSERYGKVAETLGRSGCMKVWWSVKAAWETAKRLPGRSSREPWPDGYNRKIQRRAPVRFKGCIRKTISRNYNAMKRL